MRLDERPARMMRLLEYVKNGGTMPLVVRHGERMARAELERQVVEQLVNQHAGYREGVTEWARLILDVKNMAAERNLDANIADHVRAALSRMRAAAAEAPRSDMPAEELSVAAPRALHDQPLFEGW